MCSDLYYCITAESKKQDALQADLKLISYYTHINKQEYNTKNKFEILREMDKNYVDVWRQKRWSEINEQIVE